MVLPAVKVKILAILISETNKFFLNKILIYTHRISRSWRGACYLAVGHYIQYVSSEWQQQRQSLKGDGYRNFHLFCVAFANTLVRNEEIVSVLFF